MYGSEKECYPVATQATQDPKQPSLEERLARAVNQAEERLAAAKEAQELCARNPDVARLLNLMQRFF